MTPSQSSRPDSKFLVAAFGVALCTSLVYGRALDNSFVSFDDLSYVVENPFLGQGPIDFVVWAFTTFKNANWHPLTWLSYGLDHALWGLDPTGYHLTNILLHGANVFLVALVVRHLLRRAALGSSAGAATASILVSLVFGLHPLHVESVAWVSERKDVLYAFFFLLSILAYIRYAATRRWTSFLWCVVAFILSLMSKPMAVTLPVVLLLLDWYPLRRLTRSGFLRIAVLEKAPFFALAAIASVLTMLAQGQGGAIRSTADMPLLTRVSLASDAVFFYLGKLFAPVDLAVLYPVTEAFLKAPEPYLAWGGAALVLTVAAWVLRRQAPALLWGWLFYVMTIAPTLGIIKVGTQAAADRYMYLPMLGPLVILGAGVAWITTRLAARRALLRTTLALAFAAVAAPLGLLTWQQIHVWHDSYSLWNHEVALHPEFPQAYLERGVVSERLGLLDAAVEDYEKAIALNPSYFFAYNNLAIVYKKKKQFDKAIQYLSFAISMAPGRKELHYNRAQLHAEAGDLQKALSDYRLAAALGHPRAQQYLAARGLRW